MLQFHHPATGDDTRPPRRRRGGSRAATAHAADEVAALTARRPRVAVDLTEEVGRADAISCVTLSSELMVRGAWLRPGVHLDLMHEADDEPVPRDYADAMDIMNAALAEAGGIVHPLRSGALRHMDIAGDLPALCRDEVKGRADPGEITLVKSAGQALQNLAAAEMVLTELLGAVPLPSPDRPIIAHGAPA